jgi:hypothetical protein
MTGPDVRALQRLLKAKGFPVKVDGTYGQATADAVLAAKKAIPSYPVVIRNRNAGRYFRRRLTEYVKPRAKRKPKRVKSGKGIDYAWAHPGLPAIVEAGYSFVCRYLSHDPGKNLSADETKALRAAGLDIVVVWEATANRALEGAAVGASDAKTAMAQATAAGLPGTIPIYFAVDFDAQPAQQKAISAYFSAVGAVLGKSRLGVYGGLAVVGRLFDAKLVTYGWQTYAWSRGQWDARAQLRQVENGITVGGIGCDRDVAVKANFGQWSA